jgi:hypothetical protein
MQPASASAAAIRLAAIFARRTARPLLRRPSNARSAPASALTGGRRSRSARFDGFVADGPAALSPLGGTVLYRGIQRRHLPAAGPPVPADSDRPLHRRHCPGTPRWPTRLRAPPEGARHEPRSHARSPRARRLRPMRICAQVPGAALMGAGAGTAGAELVCVWFRCMRPTDRSDAAENGTSPGSEGHRTGATHPVGRSLHPPRRGSTASDGGSGTPDRAVSGWRSPGRRCRTRPPRRCS